MPENYIPLSYVREEYRKHIIEKFQNFVSYTKCFYTFKLKKVRSNMLFI